MTETIMNVPMKERGKAPANIKFEEGIAELISLIKTSCPGKEVFMKELISLSTTRLEVKESERMDDDSAQNGGEELYISVVFDGERNYLTFEDNGVGMTELNLKTLGTMSKLGTKALISAIKAGKDLSTKNLFDVGFFTVFAVADKITIKSTHSGGTEWYMWESATTEREFTVQHIQNPGLKCQTQVALLLKKDVVENIRSSGLDSFLREHNCHSSYKIYMQSYTVINSSKEGSLGPQEEAAVTAVVTRDPQEHVGNTPATLQESLNSNTTPKDKSPAPVPKASSPTTNVPVSAEAARTKSLDDQGKGTKSKSTGQSLLKKTPKPSSEPARTKSPDHQGKGTKRKSIKQSPLQETPKSRKTPGSANTPSNSKNSMVSPRTPQISHDVYSLTSVKHLVGKNFTIAVKVMKQTEPGKERPESDSEPWRRGSWEVVDSTGRAILKVYGCHDMKYFQPGQTVLLQNVWIKKDHIAFTKVCKVEEYKGEIKVGDIKKKRRFDEAMNRKTLEEIKMSPRCKATARLHISQVEDARQYNKKDGTKGLVKKLVVKNQKNSSKTYELVTFDDVATVEYEVQGRYRFHCITYNLEKENFETVGQTLPKLVKSGMEKKQ